MAKRHTDRLEAILECRFQSNFMDICVYDHQSTVATYPSLLDLK